ncbi:MAG: sigma-70 family RNA polymerase sigma factor [Bacteroidota bacterium]
MGHVSPFTHTLAPPLRTRRRRAEGASGTSASHVSDDDLLGRIRQSDEAAFDALFDRYHDPLRAFAVSIAGADLADEVVQDVFLAIWTKRHRLKVTASLRAYLYQATRNRALNARRGRKRWILRFTDLDAAHDVTTPAPSTTAEELSRALAHAIERLPKRQRMAFRLRREHELSYDEIAAVMSLSRNTVENHIVRATKAVRQAIPTEFLGD